MLSVDAVHDSVTDDCVRLEKVKPVGAVGACVSGMVTLMVVLLAEIFPAASLAVM